MPRLAFAVRTSPWLGPPLQITFLYLWNLKKNYTFMFSHRSPKVTLPLPRPAFSKILDPPLNRNCALQTFSPKFSLRSHRNKSWPRPQSCQLKSRPAVIKTSFQSAEQNYSQVIGILSAPPLRYSTHLIGTSTQYLKNYMM